MEVQTSSNQKLAIIGCGLSGFLSAKYAKEEEYEVTVFEKSNSLGGLWSETGSMWTGMRTNSSRYTCQFTDFLWSEFSNIFATPKEVLDYFHRYVEHFCLEKLIRFSTEVTHVSYSDQTKSKYIVKYK